MNSNNNKDRKSSETNSSDSEEDNKKKTKNKSYRDHMREILDNREADFYEEDEE